MKLDKSFLTLFVGLAMAACSNDEEMTSRAQPADKTSCR